jgi:mono/diheme cytochrome c family protein
LRRAGRLGARFGALLTVLLAVVCPAPAGAQPAAEAHEVPAPRGKTSPLGHSSEAATPEARGALLYHNYCSVCHGDRGDGRSRATAALSTPPRDFTAQAARTELSRERIVRSITFGRPGTAMVGWTRQLSAADIELVADHVWQRFVQGDSRLAAAGRVSGSQAHGGRESDLRGAAPGSAVASSLPGRQPVPATALDPSLPLPLGLVGDSARGRPFYEAQCATCHGALGDGQGPRAYFIRPPPRNFIDPATRARLNRPLLYAAIHAGRPGTEMPAWSKVIDDQLIADLAEYVLGQFVLAGAPPAPPPKAP